MATKTPAAATFAHSGAGSLNHSAMTAYAASGAMSRTDTQPQRVAEAIRLIFAAPAAVAVG
jgi:predicted component of type VI protein secretion system